MNGFKIFSGTAHPQLTQDICNELGVLPGKVNCTKFSDGEIYLQIMENVRGTDCFVIQPTCAPANDNFMELLLMADALKRASAKSLTCVLPYFGYARQDRKDKPRVPISASVIARILEKIRFSRVLVMDLHSAPIQGFFQIPVDHIYALPVIINYITQQEWSKKDLSIVSPDVGGVVRARMLAGKLKAPMAIIDKRREAANVSEVMNIIGEVDGKNCLIIDDIIDTAGTLVKAAEALMAHGAKSVRAVATHGVLSVDAKTKIQNSPLEEVIIMDTIPQILDSAGKIKQISVANIFAEAIRAIYSETSVSTLFV